MQDTLKNKIRLGFLVGLSVVATATVLAVTSAGAQNTNSIINVEPSRATLASTHGGTPPASKPSAATAASKPSSATTASKTSAATPASAQAATPSAAPASGVASGRPYFIEFRARNAAQYGHTFVLYGPVGSKGTIAGFHPAGDKPDCVNCSAMSWIIGHFIPVPAETGASDGDNEPELYLLARYRIMLTAAEYKIVVAYIKKKQADSKMWQALFNNCNQWAGDIAEFMGLKVPPTLTATTQEFVEALAKENGGKLLRSAKLPDGAVREAPAALKTRTADYASPGSTTR